MGELRGPNTERNGVSCECSEPSAQCGEFLVQIRLSAFQEVLCNLIAHEMYFYYGRSDEHVNAITEFSQHTSDAVDM
jgi:hypothetical protein